MKKKLFALLLTATMILSQAMPASAAGDSSTDASSSQSAASTVTTGTQQQTPIQGTAISSLTMSKSKVTAYKGKTFTLTATPENLTGTVKWTTSKKSIAKVNKNGVVTPVKKGTATITATLGEYKATCKVTVKNPKITLNTKKLTVGQGKSITLTATPYGKSSKVTWKSSKSSVATVSKTGVVKAKKVGKVKITAKANGVSASCTITVKKATVGDAISAYQQLLTSKYLPYPNAGYRFCLIYVDNDSIPELVVNTKYEAPVDVPEVYTYVNGAVKQYKYAGSNYACLIYLPQKGIFFNNTTNTYYKVDAKGNSNKITSQKYSGLKRIYPSDGTDVTTTGIAALGTNYKSFLKTGAAYPQ